jgi:hypothetical protein
MSNEFRYDEAAHALDDKLEEVLETHKEEQKEKQSAEPAAPAEPSALERIARGDTASDQVVQLAEQSRKEASSVIAEHRVRSTIQKHAQARAELVSDFLQEAAE